jgi:hypothetical protein
MMYSTDSEPHHTVTYSIAQMADPVKRRRRIKRQIASDVRFVTSVVRSEICGAKLVKYSTALVLVPLPRPD